MDNCRYYLNCATDPALSSNCRVCVVSVLVRSCRAVTCCPCCHSSRPSVPAIDRCGSVRRVCCCKPGGQEISIDCCMAGAQQQRRAVSHLQPPYRRLNTDCTLPLAFCNTCRTQLAFVSMSGTQVCYAKTTEPIEIQFGGQTRVGPRNLVLDGKGHF